MKKRTGNADKIAARLKQIVEDLTSTRDVIRAEKLSRAAPSGPGALGSLDTALEVPLAEIQKALSDFNVQILIAKPVRQRKKKAANLPSLSGLQTEPTEARSSDAIGNQNT